MFSNVEYDRSDRRYWVTNPATGELVEFPAGSDGRRQAFQTAAHFLNADVVEAAGRIIAKQPHLESRVWRAVELVIMGRVKIGKHPTAVVALVGSQSEYGNYTIQQTPHGLTCDCLDYVDFQAPHAIGSDQRFCKHILAWKLWETTRAPY